MTDETPSEAGVDPEVLERLSLFSFGQLALYNRFAGVFEPLLVELTGPKDRNEISHWNGVFMSQYLYVRSALLGEADFRDPCDLIALIAKLNFDVDEIPENIMTEVVRLVEAIEAEPEKFIFPDRVPPLRRDDDDDIDPLDIELIDTDSDGVGLEAV